MVDCFFVNQRNGRYIGARYYKILHGTGSFSYFKFPDFLFAQCISDMFMILF